MSCNPITVDDIVKHFANAEIVKYKDKMQAKFGDFGITQPILELDLEAWARVHWKDCYDALKGRGARDEKFRKQCLGAIVRKRTKADVRYLWKLIELDSVQVLRLSPYIGKFESQGFQIPDEDHSWQEYVRMMEVLP